MATPKPIQANARSASVSPCESASMRRNRLVKFALNTHVDARKKISAVPFQLMAFGHR